ncbi:MAG: sugar phosphate isomerase/epimerase family protein [Streptosporangiales bacterium]
MKLGLCSVGLADLTPDRAITEATRAGYTGIEWRVSDQVATHGDADFRSNNYCTVRPTFDDVRAVAASCAAAGLTVVGLNPYLQVGDLDGVEQMMALAATAGASHIRLRAPAPELDGFPELMLATRNYLAEVSALAEHYQVRGLLEMHHGTLCPSASLAARAVAGLPPDAIGVIYDAGNVIVEGYEDHRMALQILGPYLAHVHLKNAVFARPHDGGAWRHRWAPLDDGVLDVPLLLRILDQAGYRGWIAVEDLSTDRPTAETLRFDADYLRRHGEFEPAATSRVGVTS